MTPIPFVLDHAGWLGMGESHLTSGRLRRALSAFRRSQQTDQRGVNSFKLHTAVNAISTVLLQQHKFFLHLHDEAKQMVRRAPVAVDLEALGRVALEAKGVLRPSVHHALDAIVACAQAGALLPVYADQSFVLELESHGGDDAKPLIDQWLDAERWLYDSLVNAEEPLNSKT